MTKAFLRACWLSADDPAAAGRYASSLRDNGTPATALYELQPKTPVMTDITSRLAHKDAETYRTLPTHLVLTALDTLDAALLFEAGLGDPPASVDVASVGVYREVATVVGTLGASPDAFAPAIQFGTFDMGSARDEWAVSEWYRTRRLPSFAGIDGGYRARRLVSVIGGPAKLGVFYEFRSLEDRQRHFEPLETVDHDEVHPTAAARTIHPPMSPSVGRLLPLD